MTTKRQREYMLEAAKMGAQVASINQTGSNHFRLVLTSRGKAQAFLIGNSDSDRRAFLNWRARVKRWLKEINP